MKKLFLVIFSFLFLFNPILLHAVSANDDYVDIDKYETKNLKDTLKEEEIELKNTKYKENDKQITIYLFRGSGCHFCQDFLTFLSSISEEYGDYFKLVSFEVWSNSENSSLMDKVSTFMGSPASGVPFIIIGDQTFPGYAEEYDDGIKSAIKALYDSDEKYDVFEEYNKAIKEAKKASGGNTGVIILFDIIIAICSCSFICVYNKKQNEKLLNKIENLVKKEVAKKETEKKDEKKKNNGKKK